LATWLDPLGMLYPEVVVNLLSELRVGVDLMRPLRWLGERSRWLARRFIASSASALRSETNEFHDCLSIWGWLLQIRAERGTDLHEAQAASLRVPRSSRWIRRSRSAVSQRRLSPSTGFLPDRECV